MVGFGGQIDIGQPFPAFFSSSENSYFRTDRGYLHFIRLQIPVSQSGPDGIILRRGALRNSLFRTRPRFTARWTRNSEYIPRTLGRRRRSLFEVDRV